MDNTELSDFFSLVSQEKSENKARLKEQIESPQSDLGNLFKELEKALIETKKEPAVEPVIVKEEPVVEFESFSDIAYLNTPKESVEVIEEPVEVVEPEPPIEVVFMEPVDENEEIESIIGYEDESENDYIKEVVTQISAQKDVHEKPITDFESLQKEFINFKHKVIEQLSSLGGGGAVKIGDMDDLDTTGREDGDSLIYNSSTNKFTFSSNANSPNFSNQLSLEDSIDGNLLMNGTDSSSSDAGDDFLQESGVDGGRDLDHNILQSLTSDIIPQASATYDLGSETKRFRNLYLESDTVDIGGATISSDGSGVITISADGVTLPTGSKDADGFELARTTADSKQTFKIVKLFTQASGLSTAAASFKFNAELSNRAVYTEAGHVFTLSNGDARTDMGADLFQF